jgi:phenylpropionate dioxygenase-like ring-hydroxylating dioxygenase large terminal subunit
MNVISNINDIAPSTSIEPLLERVGVQIEQGLVPVEIFNQPDIFKAEMERIFARGWVFVGFESEIPNASDYMLRRIGTDSVIVTRDGKGAINVLANFCRHRGTRLCHADHGNASHFRCPYHGWVFKNNGDWVGAPDKSKAYRNIEEKDWGLLKAPHVETYMGFIFASLDEDVPPLLDHLGGAAWMMKAIMGLSPGGMKVIGPPDRYRVRADWKTGAENFGGDIYHVGVAHASVQSIALAQGFDVVNDFSTHYVLDNGHSFLGHDFDKMFGEAGHLWYYDPATKERFDLSLLDPLQLDVAKKNPPVVGTIFPNLSFLRYFGSPSPGKPPVVYTSWRQWQPLGPGEMELWSWMLKWDFNTDEEAADAYAAGQYGFSSAGIFEQDDTVVWEGAPVAAKSEWARKVGAAFNLQLGMEGMGAQKRDADWTGPGEAYRPGPGEPHARAFYRHWLKEMQRG